MHRTQQHTKVLPAFQQWLNQIRALQHSYANDVVQKMKEGGIIPTHITSQCHGTCIMSLQEFNASSNHPLWRTRLQISDSSMWTFRNDVKHLKLCTYRSLLLRPGTCRLLLTPLYPHMGSRWQFTKCALRSNTSASDDFSSLSIHVKLQRFGGFERY